MSPTLSLSPVVAERERIGLFVYELIRSPPVSLQMAWHSKSNTIQFSTETYLHSFVQ
jgi:hypothetical protein